MDHSIYLRSDLKVTFQQGLRTKTVLKLSYFFTAVFQHLHLYKFRYRERLSALVLHVVIFFYI